jgi:aspartyl-tRNA(Asn)/glutamyl-tRNA(Gln) amidotransferase subunit B
MTEYLIKSETGEWEVVIGLEVHAQITSNAKLMPGAATARCREPSPYYTGLSIDGITNFK